MLRVVLAVLTAGALLAVATPAVQSVRVDHAGAQVAAELDELERAGRLLSDRNEPAPGEDVPGARRVVTVSLPDRTWGQAEIEYLRLQPPTASGESTPGGGQAVWRVAGGTVHRRVLLSGDLVGPPDGLELGPGRHRLRLRFGADGRIRVDRLNLISGEASKPGHVWTESAPVGG
jgi:hypothetical protein